MRRVPALLFILFPLLASAPREVLASSLEKTALSLLGAPYTASPLAEGALPGFDCVTLVEAALAAGRGDPDKALDRIRYRDGEAGFFTRNHFMENMWIPNAVKHGFIASLDLPGAAESFLSVDLAEWYLSNREIPEKDEEYLRQARSQKPFTASIACVPAARIDETLLASLPGETVVFFLRRFPSPPYRWLLHDDTVMVTHMGLLLNGRLVHASPARGKVVAENFLMYLKRRTPLYGAAFYEILSPAQQRP
jgi:hypothetical protein